MFEFHQVVKRFSGATVLEGLDLTVPPRRTTVLIGPSGCGKSTLLRLMMGLETPDAGQITFDGAPLTPARLGEVRRRTGYVIQRGGLFPHMTARENVELMPRHLGWTASATAERIAALAALTRLPDDALDRYPSELSGGQNQRVSLMRALMLDPDVLLLDEPLGALDPMIRFDLQEDLEDAFQRLGKTVVLVTHDLEEAAYLGHEVVLLHAGRIEVKGAIDALLDAPAGTFAHRFVRAQRSELSQLRNR